MKKSILSLVVVLLVTGSLTMLIAAPIPTSNIGKEYAMSVPNLWNWSVGMHQRETTRTLEPPTFGDYAAQQTMGYVGYDVLNWVTFYLSGGLQKCRVGTSDSWGDSQTIMGAGLHFNLINKDVADPTLMEDYLRLTAGMEYTTSTTEIYNEDIDVDEFSASLIASLVNDLDGTKTYLPNSISLFAGFLYSDLMFGDVSGFSDELTAKDAVGYTAGMEVFFTESVSFLGAMENFGDGGYTVGINVRF